MKLPAVLRQKYAFSVLFLMGANLLIGSSYRAEQDTWISLLLASVALVLCGFVLARISILCPGENVFDLLKNFPKGISGILTVLLVLYCLSQAVLTVRVYAGFVHIVSLPNTSVLVMLALACGCVWFFLMQKDNFLYRFSYLSALPILVIIVFLFIFLSPRFQTENLYPVNYKNGEDVIRCFLENLAFPFGNAFLLLGLSYHPEGGRKEQWAWLIITAMSGALSLLIVFQNILLLGGPLADKLDFVYNFSASLVNVGDFFSRIEVFSSLFFFLSAIVRTAFLMRRTANGIKTLSPSVSNSMAFPLAFFLFGYAAVVFDNTNSVFNYLRIFPYFALPIQFGVPILIWIRCEISAKKQAKSKSKFSAERAL